eukprot:31179-Pelagococcus_subviridis.AAC.3
MELKGGRRGVSGLKAMDPGRRETPAGEKNPKRALHAGNAAAVEPTHSSSNPSGGGASTDESVAETSFTRRTLPSAQPMARTPRRFGGALAALAAARAFSSARIFAARGLSGVADADDVIDDGDTASAFRGGVLLPPSAASSSSSSSLSGGGGS